MSIGFWESKVDAPISTKEARAWISESTLGVVPFPPDKLDGDSVLNIS
jgi:hypothetical protein